MNRKQCLDRATQCVLHDRQDEYGSPENHFAQVAAVWAALFGFPFQAHEVPLALAALKLVRLSGNPAHADSWVDVAGYAACGAEIASDPL